MNNPTSRGTVVRRVQRSLSAVLLGSVALIAGSSGTQNAVANGDTRTLTLYHTHRGDSTTVTFKRNGRYDADGLKQLSNFLRDWRNNKSTRMEPRLFDIVWEVHRQVGRGGMINIVSSYRSPETNAMLRARSSGVAKFSQHMLGRAMDFYITGVPVSSVREAGIRLQRGGVGFYPTSGRPFVHLDAGNIRAWPRMSRSQLARLFPDGKTVHQPAEGGQMPGYESAVAELRSRGEISLDAAYAGGAGGGGVKSFFARLFGGADQADDEAETQVAARAPARGPASSSAPASDDEGAAAPVRVATTRITPVPPSRPADFVRPTVPVATPAETVVASVVPVPPVAPARPAQAEMQLAAASVPLPPIAPAVVAAKPVPLPPTAPAAEIQLASAETTAAVPDTTWRAGAQAKRGPVGASEPALELASAIPTPRPRPSADSAIAVLAALPTPAASGDQKPREIDPAAAVSVQAQASSFPQMPEGFLGRRKTEGAELAMAYAPEAAHAGPAGSKVETRAAIAPQTRVTAQAPIDPNIRVLSPYSTPAAVYAAATAPLRRRATLSAPEGMVSTPLDEYGFQAYMAPAPIADVPEMMHPIESASLLIPASAALAGGFADDPTYGARTDRFAGSSVMLLKVRSFAPSNAVASRKVRNQG